MKINLHSHTNVSDGKLTPQELLKLAGADNVEFFSITDHDTIIHQDEVSVLGNMRHKYVKGVEISVSWRNRVIHLLHYYNNGEACGEALKKNHKAYISRADYLLRQINSLLGLKLSIDDIFSESTKDYITRLDICRYLVKYQYFATEMAVYSRLFRKLQDVESIDFLALDDIADINTEGVTVLAHPHSYINVLPELLKDIRKSGCQGLEFNIGTSIKLNDFKGMMNTFGSDCIVSFGTDYHSNKKGGPIVSDLAQINSRGYSYNDVAGLSNLSSLIEMSS